MVKGLLNKSLFVGIFSLLFSILNFSINIVLETYVDNTLITDLFFISVTVPFYFSSVIISGLSSSFIPILSKIKNYIDKRIFLKSSFTLFFSLAILLNVILYLNSEFLAEIFTDKNSRISSVELENCIKILSFIIPTLIINEFISGVLNVDNIYFTQIIFKLFTPIITILLIILNNVDSPIQVSVYYLSGHIFSSIIFLIFYITKYKILFGKIILNNFLKKVIKLFIPLFFGSLIYKITPNIDKFILKDMGVGIISIHNYSFKLFLAFTQIINSFITVHLLSYFAKVVNSDDRNMIVEIYQKIFKISIFISLQILIISFYFKIEIAEILFEKNIELISQIFGYYIITLPLVVAGTLISYGFYLNEDTLTPFIVGIFEISLYTILAFTLIDYLGFNSLPFAYFIYFLVSVLVLGYILYKKINFINKQIFFSFLKSIIIALILITIIDSFFINTNFIFKLFFYVILFLLFFKSICADELDDLLFLRKL